MLEHHFRSCGSPQDSPSCLAPGEVTPRFLPWLIPAFFLSFAIRLRIKNLEARPYQRSKNPDFSVIIPPKCCQHWWDWIYIDWFGSGPVKIDWLRLALIVSGSMIHFQDASAKAAKCREPQRIPKFTPQLHANFLIQQNQWPRSPKNHCSTSSCRCALVFPQLIHGSSHPAQALPAPHLGKWYDFGRPHHPATSQRTHRELVDQERMLWKWASTAVKNLRPARRSFLQRVYSPAFWS